MTNVRREMGNGEWYEVESLRERESESEEAKLVNWNVFLLSVTVVYVRNVRNLNPKRNRVRIYISKYPIREMGFNE